MYYFSTPCDPGDYSLGNAASCTECPTGYKCSDSAAVPVRCDMGTTSTAGQTTCVDCPAGSYCRTTRGKSETRVSETRVSETRVSETRVS